MTAGSTSNINVPGTIIAGGTIAEPQETFNGTITLNNANGQQVQISTATATSTINDDDVVHITLEDKAVTETDATQIVNYVLSTDIQSQYPIVLSFSTSDGSAHDGSDYTSQSGTTVTIPANATSVNIPVDVLGDLITEPQETYTGTVSLTSSNTQQAVVLSKSTATYTINDNDPATLAVTGFTVSEDAGTAQFTVTLSRNVQNVFTVDFATSDIEAFAGSDYTSTPVTLNFGAANALVQTVTVNINDDDLVEPTETLLGTLSNLQSNSQAVTIPTPTATGTINDNDAASIVINDMALNEDEGPAAFTVTLTGHIQDALTVDYTTNDGTAVQPSDYTTTTGTLTFPAGSASGTELTISVPIINDLISEPITETFTVDLDNIVSTGSATINDNQGVGTITDNDPITAINLTGFTISETDANLAHNFVASMDIPAQEPIIVSFTTTEGTAKDVTDFTGQSSVQYTIPAGAKSVDIPVVVIGDLVNEPQESFTGEITLVNAHGQNIAIGTGVATGTINDNDAAILSVSGFTVNEDAGTANFTISLNRSVQNAISVDFATSDNSAKAGSGLDYTAVGTTTLNFGAGNANSQTVSVAINDDNWVEPTESLTGTLSNLIANSQDVTLNGGGATTAATGTISDNDAAAITINDMSVNEADGTATFTVTLSGDIQDDLTLDYTTSNSSALAGSDYTTTSGTMTFSAGSLTGSIHTIVVPILNDNVAEPTEEYTVDLSNLQCTGAHSFSDNQGMGTILDDDQMTLAVSGFEITETNGSQTGNFVLTSNIAAQEDVQITFTTADVTANSGSDYTAQSAHTYTLSAGQKSMNISVEVLGDAIAEPTESFSGTITLSNDNSQQVTIPVAGETATSTIYDNDAIVINLSGFTVTETEGTQSKDFVVNLNTSAQHDIILNFSTADGTTQSGNDFTSLSGTLVTIPHGNTSINIPVSILGDAVLEPDESFTGTISLNTINGQQVTIGTGTATSTIIDNDAAQVTISDASITEGGNLSFTLELSNDVQGDVTVQVGFADQSTSSSDFDHTAQQYTFSGGTAGTHTITVPTTSDGVLETDETLTASLSLVSGNSEVSVTDTGEGTIIDNDAAQVTISDASITEGGNLSFTLELSNDVQGDVTVQVGFADQSTSSSDFDHTAQQYTFSGGTAGTHTITVPTTGDGVLETDETLTASLSLVSGNSEVSVIDTGEGTIIDNDAAQVTISDASITEGGNLSFTLELSNDVQGDVTVQVGFADQSTSSSDFDHTAQQYTFSGGTAGTHTITVPTTGDGVLETDETLTASLSLVSGNSEVSVIDTGEGSDLDNDAAQVWS